MDFYRIIKDMREAGWAWDDIHREFDEALQHVIDEEEDEDE